MNSSPKANPMVSGASINKGPFTNTAPGMMGGMGGPAPSYAPQPYVAVDQPKAPTGPFTTTAPGMMGGMGGPAGGMQPFSQQFPNLPPQLQQLAAQHGASGGKGGMPGAQQQSVASTFMPTQQIPTQQQGLASLLKPQQSSTNSLQ